MQKRKWFFVPVAAGILSVYLGFSAATVSAASTILKRGMESSQITQLQKDLKSLGFFSVEPTGYYGDITVQAVKNIQKKYGLVQDGVAGNATLSLVDKLRGRTAAATTASVSRGEPDQNYLVSWFGTAEKLFSIGKVATVYDIDSGLSFQAKRTYGYNHADCEPLTAADTATMKKIYGGSWDWGRRAVVITVDGRKIAASMAGMPHAGLDSAGNGAYVKSRSGGYGAGTNLDTVKKNAMDGHFDIHFVGSKTHGSNKVDSEHQKMVQKAAQWARNNN